MQIRKIQESEILETIKLSSICFEYPFTTNGQTEEEYLDSIQQQPSSKADLYTKERWGAFTDSNQMMSCLSLLPYEFQFDGMAMKGIGIGSVCTYPHFRKKGAIKGIFKAILNDMYQKKYAFSYLYPFSESFYQRYGYGRLTNSSCIQLDFAAIPEYRYPGTFHLYQGLTDITDFQSVYHTYAVKYNMMVLRDDYDWDLLTNAKGCYNNNYAYIYKDVTGTPKGYLIFKKELRQQKTLLNCRELIFTDFETLKALMGFIKTYASDYQAFRFHTPNWYNLDYCCSDFAMSQSSVVQGSNGMVRVVQVEQVLKQARYLGSGQISLSILDNDIEENNRTFTVQYENGRAFHVCVSTNLETPDIKLPIHVFSAAIVGNYNAEELNYIDGVMIHCDIFKLQDIFYKKPSWINNYF